MPMEPDVNVAVDRRLLVVLPMVFVIAHDSIFAASYVREATRCHTSLLYTNSTGRVGSIRKRYLRIMKLPDPMIRA